jgi:hypothetical protein
LLAPWFYSSLPLHSLSGGCHEDSKMAGICRIRGHVLRSLHAGPSSTERRCRTVSGWEYEMKTARLINIDQDPKSTIVYADARLSDGSTVHGLGFTFEDGKYAALWDLLQKLNERGIEVVA